MPSIQLSQQAFNITGVAFGDITVTAAAGSNIGNLYPQLIGYAVGPGGTPPSKKLVVASVVSPGVIRCLASSFSGTGSAGQAFDFSGYNNGAIYFEARLANVTEIYISNNQVLGGDLSGQLPNPTDVALHESGGQQLTFGLIPDASVIERSGTTVVGSTADKTKLNNLNTMSTQAASTVAITGGSVTGLTTLGVRDTSAAHDVDIAAVSSVALTADRTLTLDVVNAAKTIKVTANAEIGGVNTGDQTTTTLGLNNVTNDAQVKRIEMGAANGVATLDSGILIPVAQLPLASASAPGAMTPAQAAWAEGYKSVQTLQLTIPGSYANNQTILVGGILYEVKKAGFTPSGGLVVPFDISASATAQDVAVALATTINLQAGSTMIAGTPVAGVITLTAKAIGSAFNVPITGTASIVYVLVTPGTDPARTGGPIADLTGAFKGTAGVVGADGANLYVDGLNSDVLGGFEIQYYLKVKSGTGAGWAGLSVNSGVGDFMTIFDTNTGSRVSSTAAAYIGGQSAFPTAGSVIHGCVKMGRYAGAGSRWIRGEAVLVNSLSQTNERSRQSIVLTPGSPNVDKVYFTIASPCVFDGALSYYTIKRI